MRSTCRPRSEQRRDRSTHPPASARSAPGPSGADRAATPTTTREKLPMCRKSSSTVPTRLATVAGFGVDETNIEVNRSWKALSRNAVAFVHSEEGYPTPMEASHVRRPDGAATHPHPEPKSAVVRLDAARRQDGTARTMRVPLRCHDQMVRMRNICLTEKFQKNKSGDRRCKVDEADRGPSDGRRTPPPPTATAFDFPTRRLPPTTRSTPLWRGRKPGSRTISKMATGPIRRFRRETPRRECGSRLTTEREQIFE
jgi:hypothetical protein